MQTDHQCKLVINANLSSLQTYPHCKPIIIANPSSLQIYHHCKLIIVANPSSLQIYHLCRPIVIANLSCMPICHQCKPTIIANLSCYMSHVMNHCLIAPALVFIFCSVINSDHISKPIINANANQPAACDACELKCTYLHGFESPRGSPSKVNFCWPLAPVVVKPMKY